MTSRTLPAWLSRPLLTGTLLTVALSACGQPGRTPPSSDQTPPSEDVVTPFRTVNGPWPYERAGTTKTSGNVLNEVLDVYVFDGPLDAQNFASLCRSRKQELGAARAHVVALFDERVHVRTLNFDLIGEGYALDDDEGGHLRAVCHFDVARGSAELRLYPGAGRPATVQPL